MLFSTNKNWISLLCFNDMHYWHIVNIFHLHGALQLPNPLVTQSIKLVWPNYDFKNIYCTLLYSKLFLCPFIALILFSYKLKCQATTARGTVEFELEICQIRPLDIRGLHTRVIHGLSLPHSCVHTYFVHCRCTQKASER